VVEVGSQVIGVKRAARLCDPLGPTRLPMCQAGGQRCRYFTFNGYFGFGPGAQKIYDPTIPMAASAGS
jgi:hypothetical protein